MVASFPRKALIGISLVALASIIVFSQMATGVTGSSPTKQNVPTKPPFKVDHAGHPIPESLPESVGIVGPDGKISRHVSRQELIQLLSPEPVK